MLEHCVDFTQVTVVRKSSTTLGSQVKEVFSTLLLQNR